MPAAVGVAVTDGTVLLTVKELPEEVPPAATTVTFCKPFAAPVGTVAVIEVTLFTVYELAETAPNFTSVTVL